MERYENIIKIEEIRRLTDDNQYIKALKVLDTMDFNKIKSITDLSIIADVLTQNERYDDAIQVLNKIYSKTKTRRILYQLVDLSIKRGSINDAEDYLEQYIKVAPQDPYRFIFQYCIDKLKAEPYELLIASLEQLKEYEYIEVWAYELAKLYHKAGMKDKCIRECSDIVLWFGDGIYVEKARLLKAYYVGEINPIHMLKAKEKMEAEKQLGLDKTKDYSSMRSEIDRFLAESEATKVENENMDTDDTNDVEESVNEKVSSYGEQDVEGLITLWDENEKLDQENKKLDQENKEKEEPIEEVADKSKGLDEVEEAIYNEEITEEIEKMEERSEDEKDILSLQEDNHQNGRLIQIFNEADMDYNKIFGYFNQIATCQNQIETCLENILNDNTKSIHMVIAGDRKSGKTTLAKLISKVLYRFQWINSSRVAKITATKLNHVNLEQKSDQLMDSSLIIEEAGLLDSNAIEQLLHLMWSLNGHLIVILEDNEAQINKLLENHQNFAEAFQNIINLPKYTNMDLFGFAANYVEENDYQLSMDGKTRLMKYINEVEIIQDEESRFEAVMKLIQRAKVKADERNKRVLSSIIGTRQLASTDFLFINGEDLQ